MVILGFSMIKIHGEIVVQIIKIAEIKPVSGALIPSQLLINLIHERHNPAILPILKQRITNPGLTLQQIQLFLQYLNILIILTLWDETLCHAYKSFVLGAEG